MLNIYSTLPKAKSDSNGVQAVDLLGYYRLKLSKSKTQ